MRLFRIIEERIPIGEKIKVGDFWEDFFGQLQRVESVRWFEKITHSHAPHYRIKTLYSVNQDQHWGDNSINKPIFPPNQLLSEGAWKMTTTPAK